MKSKTPSEVERAPSGAESFSWRRTGEGRSGFFAHGFAPPRSRLSFAILALLSLALTAAEGCTASGPPDDSTFSEDLLLQHPQAELWNSHEVLYCFVSQGSSAILDQRQREFREAMAQAWGAEGIVRFTERACDSATVRVSFEQLAQGIAGQAGLGRAGALQLGLKLSTMYLSSSSPPDFKWVAVHEMGHVLGFAHEQDQRDSTCNYGRDYSGGGIALTSYDPNSVMNYCASRQSNALLSALDRDGFRRAYGSGGGVPPRSADAGIVDAGGGGRAGDGGQADASTRTPDAGGQDSGVRPPSISEQCEPSLDRIPGMLRSQGNGSYVSLRLANQCPNGINLAWLDAFGREVSYGTIPPRTTIVLGTYGSHAFRFRSATTNRWIFDIVMPNAHAALTIPSP